MVDNLICGFCQGNKLDGKGYGFLLEHEVRSIPFEECAVDLIEPWTVQVCGRPYKFEALPVMGPRGAPTTCFNQHGTSRSYSFGPI